VTDGRAAPRSPGRPAGRPVLPPPGGFAGPVKRSVTVAGHETSISLEPVFWTALERAARGRGLPLNALVAAVDALRVEARPAPNLASALRTWLLTAAGPNEIDSQ